MPLSEARKRANRKWDEANREKYWRCTVMIPVVEKERIVAQAAKSGKGVSEYIRGLIEEDIEKNP